MLKPRTPLRGLPSSLSRHALPRGVVVQFRPYYPPPPVSDPVKPSVKYRYLPALTDISKRTGTPIPALVFSFVILHELTAIVPVLILFFVFQALGTGAAVVQWFDDNYQMRKNSSTNAERIGQKDKMVEMVGGWYDEACKKVDYVGRKYGWLGYDKEDGEIAASGKGVSAQVTSAIAAYVMVKALFPLRIAVSLGAAPAFSRFALNPVQRFAGRFRRTSKVE